MLGLGGLDGLKLPGLVPASAGASDATILTYDRATGVMTGSAPPSTLVVIAVAGVYFASTMSDAQGRWTYTFTPTVIAKKKVSVGAVPLGTFTAADAFYGAFDPATIVGAATLSNFNLTAAISFPAGGQAAQVRNTTPRSAGKFYFEMLLVSGTLAWTVGLYDASGNQKAFAYAGSGAQNLGAGSNPPNGSVIGFAPDLDALTMKLFINGVAGATLAITAGGPFYVLFQSNGGPSNQTATFNFGASAFAYAPPSGFSAWG